MATHSSILAWKIPWTVVCQAPLSMGFSRQEYWSGLPFLSPGALPNPGIKLASLASPALAGRFFTSPATREAQFILSGPLIQFLSGEFSEGVRRGFRESPPAKKCKCWNQRSMGPFPLQWKHQMDMGRTVKIRFFKEISDMADFSILIDMGLNYFINTR